MSGAPSVGIVGAGGWGTALAMVLAGRGAGVTLWCRSAERAEAIARERRNAVYLPGAALPPAIEVTAELARATRHDFLILAVPSQAVRGMWERLLPLLSPDHTVLTASKGIEAASGLRITQVIASIGGPIPQENLAVLSGPNHAEEVAQGLPTASVVASVSAATAQAWRDALMSTAFRVYTNDDVTGVELAGALKNVIALAAGISDGLGFGDNTKAAIITRGLAEITRLGLELGARPSTFSGLAGMGDLIATCTSRHSRNARAGRRIGEGASADEVVRTTPMVIEGIPTTRAALDLAKAHGVEMPITRAVGDVLFMGKRPLVAVSELMERDPKDEAAHLSR